MLDTDLKSTESAPGPISLATQGADSPGRELQSLGIESTAPAVSRPLGAKIVHGALLTVVGSLLNKAITLGGQISLAWFLVPEDFGLVAIALSVTTIASLLTSGGLQTLLIQRAPADFDRVAGQVFWLSLALHGLACMAVLALAPASRWVFRDPRLAPLVMVVGLALPLGSLTTVYAAKLYADLRFRAITLIQLGEGAIQTGSAVLLAYSGFGPYSLLLPQLWVRLYAGLATRVAAGRIHIGKPRPSTWPLLMMPASWLMLQGVLTALQTYAPSFVIGLFYPPWVAGLYYWSYQLSAQAVFLLAVQLQHVLFPGLARLNQESSRQFEGFQRALRTLCAIIFPVCVLQAALAEPGIQLVFGPRWQLAIPVVQWFSLGMAAAPLQVLGASMLMAQGRFSTLTLGFAVSLALTLGAALMGSVLGEATMIAGCSAGAGMVGSGFIFHLACHALGRSTTRVLTGLIPPLATSLMVAPGVWFLCVELSASPEIRVALGLLGFALLYVVAARCLLPQEFARLLSLLRHIRLTAAAQEG